MPKFLGGDEGEFDLEKDDGVFASYFDQVEFALRSQNNDMQLVLFLRLNVQISDKTPLLLACSVVPTRFVSLVVLVDSYHIPPSHLQVIIPATQKRKELDPRLTVSKTNASEVTLNSPFNKYFCAREEVERLRLPLHARQRNLTVTFALLVRDPDIP